MTTDAYYNLPPEAEPDNEQKTGQTRFRGPSQFQRLRPYKRQQHPESNTLLVVGYRPANMSVFRGVVDTGIRTWFMKLFGHFVKTEDNAGRTFSTFVLCKRETNAFYEKAFHSPLIFEPVTCPSCGNVGVFRTCLCGADLGVRQRDSSCPECDDAQRHWAAWRDEWARLLGGSNKQYDLKRENYEQYKEYLKPGTEIRRIQDNAIQHMPSERYLFVDLDLDKLFGRRDLEEGEPEDNALMLFLAGKKVFDLLWNKHKTGKQFYDPRNKLAIILTRNTSAGVQYSSYTAEDRSEADLPDGWVQYAMGEAAVPDVTKDLVVMRYEEHSRAAGLVVTREEAVGSVDTDVNIPRPAVPSTSAPVSLPPPPPSFSNPPTANATVGTQPVPPPEPPRAVPPAPPGPTVTDVVQSPQGVYEAPPVPGPTTETVPAPGSLPLPPGPPPPIGSVPPPPPAPPPAPASGPPGVLPGPTGERTVPPPPPSNGNARRNW